jgi:hypothetical protein
VRPKAHPAKIQSITIPARLNGDAGVHISPAVVLHGMGKLVELPGLQVEERSTGKYLIIFLNILLTTFNK